MAKDPAKWMFHKETRPAKEFGYDWEKRLQDHYNDKKVLLRWHLPSKAVQVWYDAPSGVYCVISLDRPFEMCRAIKQMDEIQKSPKKMIEEFEAMMEQRERDLDYKVKQISRPVAEALEGYHKGRVSVVV